MLGARSCHNTPRLLTLQLIAGNMCEQPLCGFQSAWVGQGDFRNFDSNPFDSKEPVRSFRAFYDATYDPP